MANAAVDGPRYIITGVSDDKKGNKRAKTIPTADLTRLPSAIAAGKLRQMLDTREKFANTGATTMMARLRHARLFGSDAPYRIGQDDRHFSAPGGE